MSDATTIVIADDEAPARRLLTEYVGRFPHARIVGECADGGEAVRAIDEERPDLAFLDIRMPVHTGLEVVALLEYVPRIVFTTAHAEFAVRAFEVNAVDYLLKPYDFERFSTAMDRALSAGRRDDVDRLVSLLHDARPAGVPATRLFLKESQRIIALALDEVRWLEAEGDYVRVHTLSGSHLCSGSLGSLERRLDAGRFLRVHRSAVVALDAVAELVSDGEGGFVARLDDGAEVRVSRTYAGAVRSLLD